MSDVSETSRRYAAEYGALRGRVTELVAALPPDALDIASPATPDWSAHDVLAHMVGVADDAVHGRLDGVASDPWTAAQVDARRGVTTAVMLEQWDEFGPQFQEGMLAIPEIFAGQALFDAFTHEHDLRHALGRPGARDTESLELIYTWLTGLRSVTEQQALCYETEVGTVVSGVGEPVATITTSRFEIVRGATGRRSRSEIEGWNWDPKPDPDLVLLASFFTMRAEPLNE
jgi:uncharacterized protein (TIGR03083 family)